MLGRVAFVDNYTLIGFCNSLHIENPCHAYAHI